MNHFNRVWRIAAVLAIVLSLLPLATAGAAAPNAFNGVANVNGSDSEWGNDSGDADFFAFTFWSNGSDSSRKKAEVYLRYDCVGQVLYIRVQGYNNTYYIDRDTAGKHNVWIDGGSPADVSDTTGDDGSAPDFQFYGVNNSHPTYGSIADGWEASIPNVVAGNHTIQLSTVSAVIGSSTENLESLLNNNGNENGQSLPNPQNYSITLTLKCYDFGDLPESGACGGIIDDYNRTLLGNNGARHLIGSLFMGATIDAENDGQGSCTATGDDSGGEDDEDGVTPTDPNNWSNANGGEVSVWVTGGNGCLYGWIDWNASGGFGGPNEEIIINAPVAPGLNIFTFAVPNITLPQFLFARFRLYPRNESNTCTGTNGDELGAANNGEVEDYVWDPTVPTAVTLSSLTARAGANSLPFVMTAGGLGILAGLAFVFKRRK